MNNTEHIGNSEQLNNDLDITVKPIVTDSFKLKCSRRDLIHLDKAFRFAEWCGKIGWKFKDYVCAWSFSEPHTEGEDPIYKTTEELFKLFEEEDKLNQK